MISRTNALRTVGRAFRNNLKFFHEFFVTQLLSNNTVLKIVAPLCMYAFLKLFFLKALVYLLSRLNCSLPIKTDNRCRIVINSIYREKQEIVC